MRTTADLGAVLRELRRRHARRRGRAELTYREIAAATGWSHGVVGAYLTGSILPPTDRLDTLVRLFGASPAEQGALATARDRVEEERRGQTGGSPAATATTARRVPPVPRQLPRDVSGFTGRSAQVAELHAAFDRTPQELPATVWVVAGTAGVGKTALAVHFGHSVADRFPDGQLYVDLRGYGPEPPVPPGDALAGFLRALGLEGKDIPDDLAERAACYRSLLAGRRVLVLLDNAVDAQQVRPLLPGTASCAVVVTSRDRLAGLVARDGAGRIDLDVLPEPEAVTLLRTLIGARVDAAPAAARTLARRCAGLPLALRIVAEAATADPGLDLADLADELGDARRGLDLLDAAGDSDTAVRSVFSWSWRHLSAPGAHAFATLGLHPGRDIDGYAVAALAGTDLAGAREAVRELARTHLIEPDGTGRYRMHDLLRAYAAERAAATMPAADRHAAQARLLDHLLGVAALAADTLYPHDRPARPAPVPPPAPPVPAVGEPDAARRWLDGQRANLVAAAGFAARHGFPRHAADLSCVLWRYLEVGGHDQEALAVHAAAARAMPDGHRGAAVLANLGGIHSWLGHHEQARELFEWALAGYRAHADREGEARVLARLGLVHERIGDYPAALTHMDRALRTYRETGNRHGQAGQLLNLSILHRRTGRYATAAEHQRQAAALFAALGDRRLEGYALGNLGAVQIALGEYASAREHLETALAHCRACGDRGGEGSALGTLGALYRHTRQYAEAIDHLHRALAFSRETGEHALETETLNTLGETLADMGQYVAALDRHRAALARGERSGDRYEQARALDGMARAHHATGERASARRLWRQALEIYLRLGVPEAARVRAHLG